MRSTILTTLLFLTFAGTTSAQTSVNKTIPVQQGQVIEMDFDYPKLIKVSTWEKNEVLVQGSVSINGGENDDAFELETSSSGSRVEIRNYIHNMKTLPRRITIDRDGQKITFRTKADYDKYRAQNGGDYNMRSEGTDIDIELDIKVPAGFSTVIDSRYGMVEIRNFSGPLKVEATYGGIDAAVAESKTGEVTAETSYGQIYSNLDVKFGDKNMREENFHTFVSAKPGSGPSVRFDSKYGNVYLRKPVAP